MIFAGKSMSYYAIGKENDTASAFVARKYEIAGGDDFIPPLKRQLEDGELHLRNEPVKKPRNNENTAALANIAVPSLLALNPRAECLIVFKTITPLKNAKYYKESANIVQACSIKEGLSLYVRIPGEIRPSNETDDYIATLCFADDHHTTVQLTNDPSPPVEVCQVKNDSRHLPQDSVELKIRVNQKTCDVTAHMRKHHFCVRVELRNSNYGAGYSEPFISVPKVTRPMKKSQHDDMPDETLPRILAAEPFSTGKGKAVTSPAWNSNQSSGSTIPKVEEHVRREVRLLRFDEGKVTLHFMNERVKFRCGQDSSFENFKNTVVANLIKSFNLKPSELGDIKVTYKDEDDEQTLICGDEQLAIAIDELSHNKSPCSSDKSSGHSSEGSGKHD